MDLDIAYNVLIITLSVLLFATVLYVLFHFGKLAYSEYKNDLKNADYCESIGLKYGYTWSYECLNVSEVCTTYVSGAQRCYENKSYVPIPGIGE